MRFFSGPTSAVLLTAFLFASIPFSHAGEGLRILSYNVWGAPFAGKRVKQRIPEIARAIPALGADILVFEEAFSGCFSPDIGKALMRRTGYPFSARGPGAKGLKCVDSGLLVLSKHPIVTSAEIVYGGCTEFDCFSRKGALYVRIRVPNIGDVDVYATHTNAGSSGSTRMAQFEQFIALVKRFSGDGQRPAFFAGDFNAEPTSPEIKHFRDELGLQDSYAEINDLDADPVVRGGFTCDGERNGNLRARGERRRARIDYILYRGARTLRSTARATKSRMIFEESDAKGLPLSDHFGLMSEFTLERLEAPEVLARRAP